MKKNPASANQPQRNPGLCDAFTDKVTITGIEDLHKAKKLSVQLLFIGGLILSTVFGVITSFGIVQQYWTERIPVEIKFNDDGQIPFPNVTICTTAVNNVTAARELLVIPPEVAEELKALRLELSTIINDAVHFTSMSMLANNISENHVRYLDAVFTATAHSMNGGGRSIYDIMRNTLPDCNQTLSKCTYDGMAFDCCQEVVVGAADGLVCYGVPVSRANGGNVIARKPTTFNVDVRMDWKHIPFIRGDDALDGFIVIVGQPYTTTNSAPVAVAPGWHGTIKLTQIKRRRDYTNCENRSHLPKMERVSYYDQDGKLCELEVVLNGLYNILQCTPPIAVYFPNDTDGCTFRQDYVGLLGMTGALENKLTGWDDHVTALNRSSYVTEEMTSQMAVSELSRKARAEMLTYHKKTFGSTGKRCKPICDRWQYEPIVGYSELRSNNGPYDENGDISWSRITVIIPSVYNEEYVQGSRTSLYVLMCNIGGALGVCLGLSAVTVIQCVFYGCFTGRLSVKRSKSARSVQRNTVL